MDSAEYRNATRRVLRSPIPRALSAAPIAPPLNGGLPNAPKLVQWSREAVQYYEGSTLVLSCSSAIAHRDSGGPAGSLKFHWYKASGSSGGQRPLGVGAREPRLAIETLSDYSFLRLSDLRPSDSGLYTCAASNSLGQEDRTSTQVVVNGE